MGVHDLISEVEGAFKLVGELATAGDPPTAAPAAARLNAGKPCTRTEGCLLELEHGGGCHMEGHLVEDPSKAAAP